MVVNEKVAEMNDRRMGLSVGAQAEKFDKHFSEEATEKVHEMSKQMLEKKPLPRFPCKVRVSKFGALEVRVYIPDKYVKKVLKVE